MKKNKKSLLWKIESPDYPKPSFLFGTMHVKDQRAFHYESIVFTKITLCEAFASEFNLEDAKIKATSESMDLPDGMRIDELLSPRQFAKLNKIFKKQTGQKLELFIHSQPLLITNILTETILSKDMPFSLDEHLFRFAKQQNKIILGVETFEEQLEILNKIPLKLQLKSLVEIAKNIKRFRKQILQMTKVYESGDIQKIFKSAKRSTKGLRKILLYDRNEIMAHRIGKMVLDQTTLFAVGAGHLGGKKGILRLLKKDGLSVKPVKNISTS